MEEDLVETYDESQEDMIQCEAEEVEEEIGITTNDSDSLLIELVEGYPHIYDNRCVEFKDVAKKEQAWSEISAAMNWPVSECQNRWLRLREKFARETRAIDQEVKNGVVPKKRTAFALFEKMKFLKQHVKRRRTYPKVPIPNVVVQSPAMSPKLKKPQKMVHVQLPTLYATNLKNPASVSSLVTSSHQTLTLAPKPVTSSNQPAIVQIHQPALVQIIKPVRVSTTEEDPLKSHRDVSTSRIVMNESELFDSSEVEEKFSFTNGASQSKSQNADTLFGQFVAAELLKLPDAQKKLKKQKIVQILCE